MNLIIAAAEASLSAPSLYKIGVAIVAPMATVIVVLWKLTEKNRDRTEALLKADLEKCETHREKTTEDIRTLSEELIRLSERQAAQRSIEELTEKVLEAVAKPKKKRKPKNSAASS